MSEPRKFNVDELTDDDIFISAKALKNYVSEIELARAKQSLEAQSRADQAKRELLEQLKSDAPIPESQLRSFMARVKATAEGGNNELLIGRFPSELCTDHGRAINMSEENWPDTLIGLPRQGYLVWKEKLQPLGYKFSAQIVDWPDGVPGDVGLYLSW